jgi:hypothetical protein
MAHKSIGDKAFEKIASDLPKRDIYEVIELSRDKDIGLINGKRTLVSYSAEPASGVEKVLSGLSEEILNKLRPRLPESVVVKLAERALDLGKKIEDLKDYERIVRYEWMNLSRYWVLNPGMVSRVSEANDDKSKKKFDYLLTSCSGEPYQVAELSF